VNCGAIPENLLESELFGYVRGAFTGATTPRKGRVAMAEAGTLFLDEIGEMPLSLQVKLLRLLQERTYEPVGSSESVSANFRLVAATNRDLAQEVKAGRFRSDLYYRLFVCPIRLPALRERRGDVSVLLAHFWRQKGETRPVEPEALQILEAYDWPGNVRELENMVERISVCTEGPVIRAHDIPFEIRASAGVLGAEPDAVMDDESVSTELIGPPVYLHTANVNPGDDEAIVIPTHSQDTSNTNAPRDIAASSLVGHVPSADSATPIETPATGHRLGAGAARAFVASNDPGSMATAATDLAENEWLAATPPRDLAGLFRAAGFPDVAIQIPIDLPSFLRDLELAFIAAALDEAGGNKKEAAKLLGMGRTTLVEKLRRRAAKAS
jgi:sigma-54 specific flagellar transcriptional regulator A